MSSEKMNGLVLLNDGYASTAEGPAINSLDPWLEYRELDIPEPGDGEVLVKIKLANINPSDLHFIKGEYGIPRRAGVPAGFEAVGDVVKTGKGGEKLLGLRVSCFGTRSGVWAEYAIADAHACIPLRGDVRDEDAAALMVNPLTALGMYAEATDSGNNAFIMTAAGSQLCKLISVLAHEDGKTAISVVRREEYMEPVKQIGSKYVLNSQSPNFKNEIMSVIKKTKPRVLLDAVADNVSSAIFTAMPSRARWIIYGKLATEPPVIEQAGQFIFMGKRIEGFWLSYWMKHAPVEKQVQVVQRVQELFATGVWKTDVAEVIKLSDAHEALPKALSGVNTGKVLLAP